jgi:hypothetical protein
VLPDRVASSRHELLREDLVPGGGDDHVAQRAKKAVTSGATVSRCTDLALVVLVS